MACSILQNSLFDSQITKIDFSKIKFEKFRTKTRMKNLDRKQSWVNLCARKEKKVKKNKKIFKKKLNTFLFLLSI